MKENKQRFPSFFHVCLVTIISIIGAHKSNLSLLVKTLYSDVKTYVNIYSDVKTYVNLYSDVKTYVNFVNYLFKREARNN